MTERTTASQSQNVDVASASPPTRPAISRPNAVRCSATKSEKASASSTTTRRVGVGAGDDLDGAVASAQRPHLAVDGDGQRGQVEAGGIGGGA